MDKPQKSHVDFLKDGWGLCKKPGWFSLGWSPFQPDEQRVLANSGKALANARVTSAGARYLTLLAEGLSLHPGTSQAASKRAPPTKNVPVKRKSAGAVWRNCENRRASIFAAYL